MKDFYKILGVDADAGFHKIRKAYINLSKKYHPDLNGNNPAYEEKFKDILEAYTVLKDPYKRKLYDKKLAQHKEPSGPAANYRYPAQDLNPSRQRAVRTKSRGSAKKRGRQELRKDLYMGGGALLFLVSAIAILVSLEKSFYLEESYFENIEHREKTHTADSMNLLRGFTPDSVYTSGTAVKTGRAQD